MKPMTKLSLTPLIHAYHLPNDILDELSDYFNLFIDLNRSLDHDNLVFIDWEDEEDLLDFKKFLLNEYGTEIKKYEYIAITQII